HARHAHLSAPAQSGRGGGGLRRGDRHASVGAGQAGKTGRLMSASGGIPALDGPLLVIAPHPDDETLGCGGVIALATCRNVRVHTVFVTDGGASHPNSAEW